MKRKAFLSSRVRITLNTIFALLTALTWQANIANAQVIEDGLVSYWTFDEADIEGKIVKDARGQNDGEIMGDLQIVKGKVGDALQFDGVDDQVKISSLNISPSVCPTITLMAWIYPTSTGQGGQKNRRFIVGHDNDGWDRGVLIQDDGLRVGTGNDGTDYWETGAEVKINTWQHIAVVYDAEDIKFYKDGVEYSYGSPGALGDGNTYLLIGAYPNPDRPRYFQGIIDEACVYSRALTEAEIKKNMAATELAVEKSSKLALTWGGMKVL